MKYPRREDRGVEKAGKHTSKSAWIQGLGFGVQGVEWRGQALTLVDCLCLAKLAHQVVRF